MAPKRVRAWGASRGLASSPDAVREVGRLDVEAEELVGAALSLGTSTRFAGTIDGVRFDFQRSDAATVEATGTANSGGAVELLVDLPAVLAFVAVEDETQDGSLDAADAASTDSVSFGAVSSRSYALRTPDPSRTEVLAIEGDRSDGEQVYADTCASCHGADGEGAVGPALQGHVAGMHRADTVDVVLDGEGTMGPVQDLDPAELANGVAYSHYSEW
jgi:mono/diheme cytochrome c family protein